MNKIKNILIAIIGALGAFLMLVIQSKNRQIDKKKSEIEKISRDKETLKEVISGVEQDAKKLQEIKKDIRSKPISSVVDELRARGEYKD